MYFGGGLAGFVNGWIYLTILEFELRASHFLDRHFSTLVMSSLQDVQRHLVA
jgi:hypothetical protein